jgi:hypothetical protein
MIGVRRKTKEDPAVAEQRRGLIGTPDLKDLTEIGRARGPTSGGHAAACMFSTDTRTRPM